MPSSEHPWYDRIWAAILLLVLFPPAGFYLVWRLQAWDSRTKRAATVAASLWLVAAISAITLVLVLGGGGEEGAEAVATDPQEAALHELEAASDRPLDTYYQNGFPRFVHADVSVPGTDAVERARNFLETYRDLYLQSDPNLGLAVRDVRGPGEDGLEHVAFYQTFRGYPVYAGEIVVSLDGDRVYATVGGLLSDLVLNTIPGISPREAEDIARDDVDLAEAPIFGETGLLVFDPSLLDDVPPDPHMAWQVTLGDRDPWQVFVDAHTAEVLFKYPLTDAYDLDLEDANGANAASTNCYWNTTDDDEIGNENGFTDSDYLSDQQAVNAWWYSKYVYNFYLNTFGRDSYDNDDGQIEVYVHAGVPNARWTGASIDCDLIEFANGWVAYDVMVHEFTHGVMDFRPVSQLPGSNQGGALEESLADTFAYVADPDCLVGEDVSGGAIRNFCSPQNFGHPDRMGEYSSQGGADNGGVHSNNGILNKAASLIASGGSHPDTGVFVGYVGRQKLGKLYYAVEAGITSGYQFIDFRNAVVARAVQWAQNSTNGFTPDDACDVRHAFFAVELGHDDADCDGVEDPADPDDDNDGVADTIDNCPRNFNPAQKNTDGDGLGDQCDPDADGDGVPAPGWCVVYPTHPYCEDNCPLTPNADQKDGDSDGRGDACSDFDNDGIVDHLDNCPRDYNPGQANVDSHLDDEGDACDPDTDGDGLSDDEDNCPVDSNPDQTDSDGDFFGDACDLCPDVAGDTYAMGYSCIQLVEEIICNYWPLFDDADGDTIPDACDDSSRFASPEDDVLQVKPQAKFLKPDGRFIEVDVEAGPGPYAKIPLAPCPPPADRQGNTDGIDEYGYTGTMPVTDGTGAIVTDTNMCRNAFPQDELVLLVLRDLHPDARAWVSDDEGRSVGPRGTGDVRVLRFRPLGGRKYFLNLVFGPALEPGQRVTFSAVMTTGSADEQVGPMVDEPSAPHFVPPPLDESTPGATTTPTPTSSARPTPSATAGVAATPTPTPTRLLPTATRTPRPLPKATDTPAPLPMATDTPMPGPTASPTRATPPTATTTPARYVWPTATNTPGRPPMIVLTPTPTMPIPR